jgi:hypothetical protein
MAFEPPTKTRQFRAVDLENSVPPPYILKALNDDDSEWNLVEQRPRTTLTQAGSGQGFLPETTTVVFEDGKKRWFDPNDPVLVADVTARLGGDKQHIREVGDGNGWDLTEEENKDVFTRGGVARVVVYYEGDEAIEARRFEGGKQKTFPFTGKGAKTAAISWLKHNPHS